MARSHSVLVAEIACATVLLVATTLVVSSFIRLTRADLGFERSQLLVITSLSGLQGRLPISSGASNRFQVLRP
jgi:hypothetical protein